MKAELKMEGKSNKPNKNLSEADQWKLQTADGQQGVTRVTLYTAHETASLMYIVQLYLQTFTRLWKGAQRECIRRV